jgi:hypothetical protein
MVAIKFRIPKPCTIEVDLDKPVKELLQTLVREHGFQNESCIKLLLSGKTLCLQNADTTSVRELGIVESSAVMALKVLPAETVQAIKEEDSRQKAIARLAQRGDTAAARL